MKHEPFNESTEMYLKTVDELAGDDEPVAISALAKSLGVSNVSATEMVHRLKEQGLFKHTPYKGVTLTADGRRRAANVVRSHRLWECFLVDQLHLSWAQAHESACRLEHATDGRVTEALAAFLGYPATCPHGNPIPSAEGETAVATDVCLSTLKPVQHATITRIYPESTLLLEYLEARDFKPDRAIVIEELAPFNGPMMISIAEQTHALGHEVASHIFVTLSAGENEN